MEEKQNNLNRRNFLKTIGAAGVGSVLASAKSKADEKDSNAPAEKTPAFPHVPKRPLGKTGVQVPCLSMGGTVNLLENQIMLRKSLETASCSRAVRTLRAQWPPKSELEH